MPRRILAPVLALVFALLAIGRVAEATNESTEHGNHSQACSVVWKAGAILDADLTNDDPEHPGLMVNLQGEKVAYSNGGYLAEVSPAFGDPGLFEMNHFYVGSGATLNQVWRMPVASDLPLLGAKVVVTLPEGIVNPTFSASSTNAMMSRWGAPYSDYTWAQRDLAAIDNGDGTWTVNLGDLEAKSGTVFEFSGGLPAGTDVNTRKIASAVMTATYPQGVGECPITDLPAQPTAPTPGPCEVALMGRTVWAVNDKDVTTRAKWFGAENGEVNADGWGSGSSRTLRLYGATDVAVKDATYTATAAQGFVFKAGSVNTELTPGGGALRQGGYTGAVAGMSSVTISADGKNLMVSVDAMPAKSSFSFNVTVVLDGSNKPLVVDETLTASTEVCAPTPTATETVPAPTVTATATQTVPAPTVTATATQTVPAPTATATATQTLPAPPMMTERPTELPRTGA